MDATFDQKPMTQTLLRLVEQSLWANRQWVEFVYLQPDPEVRPRELLAHVMVGERVWFERIAGQQRATTMFPLISKDELIRGFTENVETFRQLIGYRLGDVIHFRRGTGEEYHARVEDIIQHLFTHGYHHNTDHINFLIENRL